MAQKTESLNNKYLPNDISFLLEQNNLKPIKQPEKLISKFIDGRRVMPPGSPYEGIYRIDKTPYIIEIIDNMSPFSPIRHTALKKGVQTAATTAAENVIAYYMGERPVKMMYMSATDDLLEKFSNTRLDPLIDSCGFRELIFSQTENVKSRKSGDKAQYKEFIGGTLALTSAQSPSSQRSESIQIMLRDEIDGAPAQLKTGEGNFIAVSEGRAEAFGDRAKIFDFSTPGLWGESLIDMQYNKGDKRKYFVPCPHCKKKQFLSLGNEKSDYGLKGDYKAGRLIQGYYQCYYCHEPIFDHHKIFMLENGIWKPTATPIDDMTRSYHLPSFYSPPGMTSFTQIRKKYDEAQAIGDDGMRSFTNLYLGKSFKPSGERPKFESVIELRSAYPSGEVPSGIMFLTGAVDVQQGIAKYKDMTNEEILKEVEKLEKKKDDVNLKKVTRLEIEICGHGADFRTASITRKLIFGRIDDHTSGAWEYLTEWATDLNFKRKDGYEFRPKMIFIDSGYGRYTDVVYNFCDSWPGTYAIKGDKTPKQDKLKLSDIDIMKNGNISRFKISTSGAHRLILINTNYYKGFIYRNMANKTDPINGQPPNSHQTPSDYPDYYFHELRAEEHKKDGSFHNLANRHNEALDLLVYNKAAADFFIEGLIIADREVYKRKYPGINKEKLYELANRRTVTMRYEAELRSKGW
jgi:phage terminase large subunit GpA-like protein